MKAFFLGWLISIGAHAVAADSFQELVAANCLDCHDATTSEGELDLTNLGKFSPEHDARVYERMLARVANGEMPPPDVGTLNRKTQDELVALLETRLDRLARRLENDPGDVPMIRLTPYEYRNIMRDLSGGVLTRGGRFLPNEGGAGEGFANVGAAQSMTTSQYEKYVDAAIDSLSRVRFYPIEQIDRTTAQTEWTSFPRPDVDDPSRAKKEVVDEILSWHIAQQQRWGQEHRDQLELQFGFIHPAYLEAAWRYKNRDNKSQTIEAFALIEIDPAKPSGDRVALAPAALRKWLAILESEEANSVHAEWAKAWRKLPQRSQGNVRLAEIRERCIAIVAGTENIVVEDEEYAPPYEISFHEAKEEVLEAANKEGHWPFRIDIGDAKELFLVVTDAGDGGRGEYAVWRRGRFVYRDGTSTAWQDVVTIRGANSGKTYPFGYDGENEKTLGADAVGAKPPGALKFDVPRDAIVFEVDLSLDKARTKLASIQALVLKLKPKSQSYVSGRFVFGGRKRPVTANAKRKKEHERALRKRNIAEANKTKIGLNAERNVFADWTRTSLEDIGGPWPDQQEDRYEASFPYHYTVAEVIKNATPESLSELRVLQDRLASLVTANGTMAEREVAYATIHSYAEQLWRRSVGRSEITFLTELFDASRAEGLSFDSSLKAPLLAILISPDFLYRGRSRHDATNHLEVSDRSSHEIASRLSFFLWASIPDAELRRLADNGNLLKPDVLKEQVRRMIADPRSRSLATDFAGQVWGFSDFSAFANPDGERFKAFTPELRASMQHEVELFLTDVFQNDRPLSSLLDADYTFVDQRLREHYGLKLGEPQSSRRSKPGDAQGFQRAQLPPERGGLVTMGLFLTKTSLPLRTSPVQRGVWLMESVLGRHLPNPPADVPSLSDDSTNAEGESIRKQLELHRADSSCASCHDKIDPLGMSLENFDAIGRYRDAYPSGERMSTDVTTHEGVRLRGAVDLRAYLKRHQDEFIEHFNRKLLGYALGRSVTIGDRALLRRMKLALEESEFRFSAAVEVIVLSRQFRSQRNGH